MSLLRNTDIAVVSDKKSIHVFYQTDDGKFIEAVSEDGQSWSKGSTLAGGEIHGYGASLTAFYCEKDKTNDDKPSIHVIYLDNRDNLVEQVKAIADKAWKKLEFPNNIVKPVNTTKLASGVCHDGAGSSEAHQWVYFSNQDSENKAQVAELRKAGSNPWKNWKVLPQEYGAALPGTAIGASLTNPTTFLQLQSHDYSIYQCEGGYDQWSKSRLVVQPTDTIARSPLASVIDANGKSNFFFAGKINDSAWVQSDVGGVRTKVGVLTPGSFIGAVLHNDKQYVFMNEAFHPTELSVYVHEGSAWKSVGQIQV